ncbi:MAG: L-rhamnose isomerase [Firmicutes bacterium]|nr:L-rhamnose isomerase [Bacillota bacterium]
MSGMSKKISENYQPAKEAYAFFGVDTDAALATLEKISISLHCWQGDDVTGFEGVDGLSGGGILATGNYPGRARNGEELRRDLQTALSLIPGKHRVNLHAIYAETEGNKVDRDQLTVAHFQKWIHWAKSQGIGLDFNPSFFSHPLAGSGFTLASKDEKVRRFWVEHGKRSREIAAAIGKELGSPAINNIWIPDGSKDLPVDRKGYRQILKQSLDEILERQFDRKYLIDSVESKLFGIGSEAFVVGSHEFYLGYALQKDILLCLDMGHFHPTEVISDKIPAILTFAKGILIHVSRGIRWDSDHVVILNDDLMALAQEVKRSNSFDRTYFALDFFDASINRITAWVTGARALLKAILIALLEPTDLLLEEEAKGRFGHRLALMEEFKTLPYQAVWDQYCAAKNCPVGVNWLKQVDAYEEKVLRLRK